MPKLVQLNVTSNWGSTGRIAEGISAAARSRGWESIVFYGRHALSGESEAERFGSFPSNVAHYLGDRLLDAEGRGSLHATRRLIRRLREINPDVVQLHNIHDHWLNYPELFHYLASTGVAVFWSIHDCWPFTGHCYHFDPPGCMKWQQECSHCPKRHPLAPDCSQRNFRLKRELFTSPGLNLHLVATSQWISNILAKSFLGEKPRTLIYNGIDVDNTFTPANVSKNEKHLLAVSNVWPPYKGLDDVCHLRQLLSPHWQITLVGLSDKQIRTLPPGITGIRRTQSVAELVKLYSSATALINVSHSDTFPTVNLEALACGTPVVTYQTGGSPEAVDSRTGIVVDRGDVEAMARAVVSLTDNPLSSAACRNRAENCFNRHTQFLKYIDLYTSCLSSKTKSC